jgi:hypothetical protein
MPHLQATALPIGTPAALGYQFFAYPLAIQATEGRTSDWILSNYIQLEFDKDGWGTDVPFSFYLYDYAASPWMEVVRGTRRWYSSASIRDVIKAGIDKGYYAYTLVDEFHVPHRRWHGRRHLLHDILVHGYDDRTETFSVLGFDDRMRFRTTEMGQEEFVRAYASLDGPDVRLDGRDIGTVPVLGYRLRSEPDFGYPPLAYPLNLPLLRQTLDEYLWSRDTSEHFQMLRAPRPCVYGIECYEHLEHFIRDYAAGNLEYDIRHLHVLWEHKRFMTARIQRLGDFASPLESLEVVAKQIETTALALRNSMMRNELDGGRREYLDGSLRMLHQIRDSEMALLPEVLDELIQPALAADH